METDPPLRLKADHPDTGIPDWLAESFGALKPPDRRALWEWAEAHYVVPVSARPGRFRIANSPWVRRMMEKVQDTRIRTIVVLCSAQSSKTEALIIILNWIISEDPSPTMWVTANKDEAQKIMLERIWPAFRSCKPVSEKIPDDRTMATILEVHFPGMVFEAGGANSKAFLQSRVRRNLLLDEVRNWKPWALPMVLKRVRTWWNSRVIMATTPAKSGDTVDREFKFGTQEHYHVECPHCHKRLCDLRFKIKKGEKLAPGVVAEFDAGLTWDTSGTTKPDGKWNFEALSHTIRYVWPCCGAVSIDTPDERARITDNGEFVSYNPGAKADRVSFTWSALLPTWVAWGSIVEEFLRAKDALDNSGNVEPLKTFITETLGVSWDERQRGMDEEEPMTCCRAGYDTMAHWPEENRRFMLIDVQEKGGRHYYWIVRAFAITGASRLISWGIARSLDEITELGVTYAVKPSNICFDTGFPATEIYKILLASGRSEWTGTLWKGMKGERSESYLVGGIRQPYRFSDWIDPFHGTAMQGTGGFLRIILFSKMALLDRVEFCQKGFGPNYLIPDHTPTGCPPLEDYIAQATAYKRLDVESAVGEIQTKWHQLRPDDHWGSCERMAIVAAMATGLFATPPPKWKDESGETADVVDAEENERVEEMRDRFEREMANSKE